MTAKDAPQRFCSQIRTEGVAVLRGELTENLLDSVYSSWSDFFSSESKHQFRPAAGGLDGFFSIDSERAVDQRLPDPKEFFHFYLDGTKPENGQVATTQLFLRLRETAEMCLGWLDAALPDGLRPETSMPLKEMIYHSKRLVLRIANYPFEVASRSETLAAEHHDINLLTLLPTPTHDGLEVRTPNGSWAKSCQLENTTMVIPGEMLDICTRGHYPATLHRVLTPSDTRTTRSRMSLSFFANPHDDVVLADGKTAKEVLKTRLIEIGYSI